MARSLGPRRFSSAADEKIHQRVIILRTEQGPVGACRGWRGKFSVDRGRPLLSQPKMTALIGESYGGQQISNVIHRKLQSVIFTIGLDAFRRLIRTCRGRVLSTAAGMASDRMGNPADAGTANCRLEEFPVPERDRAVSTIATTPTTYELTTETQRHALDSLSNARAHAHRPTSALQNIR